MFMLPSFMDQARLMVAEDTKDVKVGTLIAVLAPEGEDWKSIEIPKLEEAAVVDAVAPSAPAAPPAPADTPSVATALPAVAPASHGNFGPSVRLLLEKFGLGEEQVPPSGPHGKLLKGDVLKLVKEKNIQPIALASVPPPEAPKPAAAAPAPVATPAPVVKPGDGYQDIELTNMRRTIAKRLMQSKGSVAHSYGTIDCSVDKLVNMRKQFKKDGFKVSMNDLIIKAVAVALQQCPEMNCVWQGNQLVHSETVDISIAVATDAGLITPIVKNADMLGIQEIAEKVRDLAGRARENKLKLEEFQGGSFTISNLGMFGISEFSAIINPPQCGILAVGGGRLTVDESGSLSTRMSATLSYDRLGVDDDSAAVFLSILKDLLEEPKTLMLGALPVAHLARGLL
ncbi:pyruvate dehydrogenase protein X component-like isoform X3 [Oratosquilla oratoria]|uniref:pyruvate dehydrogenase protein X component-like isoform X3 n=1 Tax=Oratosquilla oratoria TaxID=337810 RepID=UPI003F76D918